MYLYVWRNDGDPECFPKRYFQTEVDADVVEPRWILRKKKIHAGISTFY
jgi:hypothetical protein